jgi:hypothetical protein
VVGGVISKRFDTDSISISDTFCAFQVADLDKLRTVRFLKEMRMKTSVAVFRRVWQVYIEDHQIADEEWDDVR